MLVYQRVSIIWMTEIINSEGFQKWGDPIAGWLIIENPIEMDAH